MRAIGSNDRNGSKPFRRSRNTTFSVLGLAEGVCGQALQVFGVCDPGAFDCLKGRRLFGWFQRATNWNPKIQVLRSTLVNVAEHHETPFPPLPSSQKDRRRFAVASPKVEDLQRAKNAWVTRSRCWEAPGLHQIGVHAGGSWSISSSSLIMAQNKSWHSMRPNRECSPELLDLGKTDFKVK